MVDSSTRSNVYDRVRACLKHRIDTWTRTIRPFDLNPETFEITKDENIEENLVSYTFELEFHVESNDSDQQREQDTIVLDQEFALTFDKRDRVRISGEHVLHPRFWAEAGLLSPLPDWLPDEGPWEDPLPGVRERQCWIHWKNRNNAR